MLNDDNQRVEKAIKFHGMIFAGQMRLSCDDNAYECRKYLLENWISVNDLLQTELMGECLFVAEWQRRVGILNTKLDN
jgi:hypothetical protein